MSHPPPSPSAGPDPSDNAPEPQATGPHLPATVLTSDGDVRAVPMPARDAAGHPEKVGRYPVFGEIARGGMGAVLHSRDPELGRDLAIKVLLPRHQDRLDMVRRFLEEAQIGGQLQHPGVVPVYELGHSGNEQPYFTMKLVQGRTLAALLAERQDVTEDLPRFLTIFEQVCQTLAYAHSKGVIHRDLKPLNVMVGAFGEVQVMDWGLAKVLARSRAAGTPEDGAPAPSPALGRPVQTGAETDSQEGVMGTPAYMAPEQARGQMNRLDERSDVFSLGALLCEILTGAPPYRAPTVAEVFDQARTVDLADALARLEHCGADLELIQLARACLAPQPTDRPGNARVVAGAVTAHVAGVQERLRAAELESAAAQARAAEAQAKMAAERRARRLAVGLALAVVAIVLLGGGGWLWIARDRADRLAEQDRLVREREQQVNASLERVATLRALARQRPTESLSLMAEALAVAQRADGLLAGDSVGEDLRRRVRRLVADLQQEQRDRRMLARLDEARLRMTDNSMPALGSDGPNYFDFTAADPLFTRAFRWYGIDVQKLMPAEAARQLRRRAIRGQLAVALDEWAATRKLARDQQRLRALARAVDANALRNQLRDALARGEPQALRKLAAGASARSLPAHLLALLGRALRWAHAPDEAVQVLRAAQRRFPDDFWINHELAWALSQLRPIRWDEVIRFHTVAAALRKESPGAQLNLAHGLLLSGQLHEAVASYRKALELQPDLAIAHTWLGSALVRQGKIEPAVAACRQALALQPNLAQAHNILGDALRLQGQLDESAKACRRAIALQPTFAEAQNNLGNALQLQGRLDDAVAAYRKALALQPKLLLAHANLGGLLWRQGQRDEAIAALRQAVAVAPDLFEQQQALAQVSFLLGFALLETGRPREAIPWLRKAIALRPDQAESHHDLSLALGQVGDREGALAAAREAVRLKKDFVDAHLALGNALADRGSWKEAIASYRSGIRLQKGTPAAHFNLGNALVQTGDLDGAVAAYRSALALKPAYPAASCNLGHVLQRQGEFRLALAAFQRGHALGVKTPNWRFPSRRWVRTAERLAAFDDRLEKVLRGEAKPAGAVEQVAFARFCQRYKRLYGTAAHFWQEALTLQPNLAEEPRLGRRYQALCAAALAGCGRGRDAGRLDETQRSRWRQQALTWLRAELAFWARHLVGKTPEAPGEVEDQLRRWQRDPNLAGLREDAALARLPQAEREAWRRLWADVEKLLEQARDSG